MAKEHYLKTLTGYFQDVCSRKKTFDLRKNDRDFEVGDILILEEFDGNKYTGSKVRRTVTMSFYGSIFLKFKTSIKMANYSKKTLEKMLAKAESRFEKADKAYTQKVNNIGWGTWNRKWKHALPSNKSVEAARARIKELEYQISLKCTS